jgi:hypothetical protein
MSPVVVSVAGTTVAGMGTERIHTCIYFDDGDPELLCVCGGRGMILVEDDDSEGMLVALLDDVDISPAQVTVTLRRELAVSA